MNEKILNEVKMALNGIKNTNTEDEDLTKKELELLFISALIDEVTNRDSCPRKKE